MITHAHITKKCKTPDKAWEVSTPIYLFCENQMACPFSCFEISKSIWAQESLSLVRRGLSSRERSCHKSSISAPARRSQRIRIHASHMVVPVHGPSLGVLKTGPICIPMPRIECHVAKHWIFLYIELRKPGAAMHWSRLFRWYSLGWKLPPAILHCILITEPEKNSSDKMMAVEVAILRSSQKNSSTSGSNQPFFEFLHSEQWPSTLPTFCAENSSWCWLQVSRLCDGLQKAGFNSTSRDLPQCSSVS